MPRRMDSARLGAWVNVLKKVRTNGKWNLCPVVREANSRLRDRVRVAGRTEVHIEGVYYLEWLRTVRIRLYLKTSSKIPSKKLGTVRNREVQVLKTTLRLPRRSIHTSKMWSRRSANSRLSKKPVSLLSTTRARFVALLVMVTLAPGITAVESVTLPEIPPRMSWAGARLRVNAKMDARPVRKLVSSRMRSSGYSPALPGQMVIR